MRGALYIRAPNQGSQGELYIWGFSCLFIKFGSVRPPIVDAVFGLFWQAPSVNAAFVKSMARGGGTLGTFWALCLYEKGYHLKVQHKRSDIPKNKERFILTSFERVSLSILSRVLIGVQSAPHRDPFKSCSIISDIGRSVGLCPAVPSVRQC